LNPYLELFGYFGTGLVLLSMTMASLVKLRWINLSGSVISGIYAAACSAWPVVLLNSGMILINSIQLLRHYRKERA